jgi:glycogen debranching enzyme
MTRLIFAILLVSPLLAGCPDTQSPPHTPISLNELAITVGESGRAVAYTNKNSGVFYTEARAPHADAWQGWRVMSSEILEDYRIMVDCREVVRSHIVSSTVYPHQLVRLYSSGMKETVTLLDSIDVLVVELENVDGSVVAISPLFQNSHQLAEFELSKSAAAVCVARQRHLVRSETENYPVWIGLTSDGNERRILDTTIIDGASFGPCALEGRPEGGRIVFLLTAGDSVPVLCGAMADLIKEYPSLIRQRAARMESLLESSYFRSDNPEFDKAVHWAMLSLDALIMRQVKDGIFAGLPWFDNYWGRDSFISLPGATLVTGHFEEAKKILRSFAEWQDTVETSPTFGRIPNLVTVHSISYNTADGTPRFIIGLEDYFRYTNDSLFVLEMYPVVKRSIEGTLAHHVDSLSFITHGDAETWMDAVGPEGPWSPRGNRACDLQALWHEQLLCASRMATRAGDTSSSGRWKRIAEHLETHFNARFVNPANSLLYDHLNADDSPDTMFRPNQLFALDLIRNTSIRSHVLSSVTSGLVYPHGVASLHQDDPAFHPFHHFSPYYVQDAAYHQGIVWTWLAGAWIELMNDAGWQDTAWRVTSNMAHQILHRGTVGTLSELLDAAPRPGEAEPRLSGTYSQAWSLAEFLRVLFRSYVGARIDLPASALSLSPRLPDSIHHVETILSLGDQRLPLVLDRKGERMHVVLGTSGVRESLSVRFFPPHPPRGIVSYELRYLPSGQLTLDAGPDGFTARSGENELAVSVHAGVPIQPESRGPALAIPVVREGLQALKGPSHRLLRHEEIALVPSHPLVLLDATDPSGDDIGSGSYTYPTTPYLTAGSLDLLREVITYDSNTVQFTLTFRTLSNPGWHPEYGFQLTYAAILIDTDGVAGSGSKLVGMNSGFRLPGPYGYERAIFVGGGVRVTDARGAVLCEYLPQPEDSRKPLGDAASGRIQFSIPAGALGNPTTSWRVFTLVGCQDDHGGAGVGEFRNVDRIAGEWAGGGRRSTDDPNVYDVLLPR